MQRLWRAIVDFIAEALMGDADILAQQKREAALRRERWLEYLS